MRKMVVYGFAVLLFIAAATVAGWFYMTSNVETPEYAVVTKDGDIEIRDYPALRVAEVTRTGKRQEAVSAGFGPLASYIFAKDREGEKIAMTAPVTQQKTGEEWVVQFTMPKDYALKDLPKPADSEVRLMEIPAKRRAAIKFSGTQTDELILQNEKKLRGWLATNNLEPAGPPVFAYYNDPFTPGPLRRNEVIFDLQ